MYDNLDLYCKKIENNNMIYSVDKLRLKTYISYFQFSELEFLMKTVYKEKVKKFWVSDRVMCFKYNYVLEVEEGKSFYFGFMHNNENVSYHKENLTYNFTIEFNPNKIRDDKLLKHILCKFDNWLLRSLDLAIDIPINICDLLIDIRGKRKMQTISYGGDNLTHSYGKNDGRIKIYNKKIESNLPIPGDLTRVEVSREFDDFEIAKTKTFNFGKEFFPCIYLNKYLFSFLEEKTKNKTLMAILYAVQAGYPLKDLTRDYRKKIKDLLEGGSSIKFDEKSANQAFCQLIYYYFVNFESKQRIY